MTEVLERKNTSMKERIDEYTHLLKEADKKFDAFKLSVDEAKMRHESCKLNS